MFMVGVAVAHWVRYQIRDQQVTSSSLTGYRCVVTSVAKQYNLVPA